MINWISKQDLQETLDKDYGCLLDELCCLTSTHRFLNYFYDRHGDDDIDWKFYIKDRILVCQNNSKFEFRFPLP